MIGNSDLRKVLEVAMVLIDQAKPETQTTNSIRKVRDALPVAIQFLSDHPGPPPTDTGGP